MNVETQLRETLLRAADEIGSVGPAEAVGSDNMHARARTQRRRRTAILSAGLAVLLIAVAVPTVLSRVSGQDDRVVDRPTVPFGDIYDVPTRGSLAADTEFIEAVRQLSWVSPAAVSDPPLPDAPVETRHVVFAGDVAEGRWALVVGDNTAQPTGAAADPSLQTDFGALGDIGTTWFVGPPEARPEQMERVTIPYGISADQPTSLYDGLTGALVVISAPGDVIEISPRPEVAADATVSRNYTDTGTADGVAVVAVEPTRFVAYGPPAVQYRVSRAGVVVSEQTPQGYIAPEGAPVSDPLALDYLRPSVEVSSLSWLDDKEQVIAFQTLVEYGLQPEQVTFVVHYDGPMPGAGQPSSAGLTVVTATLPSGAVVTRAEWWQELAPANPGLDASVEGGSCASGLSAAGVPAAERTIALQCVVSITNDDGTQIGTTSWLVVLAPPNLGSGAVSVTVDSGTSIYLEDDGVWMIPFPWGVTSVTITGADGSIIDEVPILTE